MKCLPLIVMIMLIMLMRRKRMMMVTNLEGLIRPVKFCICFFKERRPELFLGVRLHEHQLAIPEDEDD